MELKFQKQGDVILIPIEVEVLDASNSEEFKSSSTDLLKEGGKAVFDMDKVRFVDSSGCGALLACLMRTRKQGGEIRICCLKRTVMELFKMLRLDSLVEIFDTREEAIQAFQD